MKRVTFKLVLKTTARENTDTTYICSTLALPVMFPFFLSIQNKLQEIRLITFQFPYKILFVLNEKLVVRFSKLLACVVSYYRFIYSSMVGPKVSHKVISLSVLCSHVCAKPRKVVRKTHHNRSRSVCVTHAIKSQCACKMHSSAVSEDRWIRFIIITIYIIDVLRDKKFLNHNFECQHLTKL
ncbi:unnamed protein product [Chrysodeixis includens]|uniref:Uncharacterized protein n=1 Tax=Chrysodeixis includens TaxID=689277 RepID=A0A9N8Q128_CHRIL|nr:unnamed protein product [Chrysodeixis includens]